jgi:hypothetical protein
MRAPRTNEWSETTALRSKSLFSASLVWIGKMPATVITKLVAAVTMIEKDVSNCSQSAIR